MSKNAYLGALRLGSIVVCGLGFLLPIWWMLVTALRQQGQAFRYLSLSVWSFLPNNPTLANFVAVLQSPFAHAMVNTAIVSLATVIVGLSVCSMAAFALAAMEFRGRTAVFAIVVVSFLIPFDAIVVPLAQIIRSAHLQNSYVALVLPAIGNGMVVFLLRQFFLGIPTELRDAAMMDGLGWFGIFVRIYLPLSTNALISAAIILFIGQWQAYLWPLLVAPASGYKMAAVAIADMSALQTVRYEQVFAAAFIISLIPLLVLWIALRFFGASVAMTGSKE
jgi:ABC-type glycerol-3-phosphate transport system permease component